MKLSIDTGSSVCICTFYIPKGATRENTRFLAGRVQVSCMDGVAKGDGIVAAGDSIPYILNAVSEQNTPNVMFEVMLKPNSRKTEESHPDWFASQVKTANAGQNQLDTFAAILESIDSQVAAARKMLGR